MKLVVGLGNPGPRYETTRHNIGFLVVDQLIDLWGAQGPTTKHEAEVYEAQVAGEKVLILKPQTFMNLSGRAVAPFFRMFKCAPEDVTVIYDDLDLKPFALRVKKGGGAGGHNGIKSMDASLGSENNNYHRIRLGIGHPRTLNLKIDPADYVLSRFDDHELGQIELLAARVRDAAELILKGDTLKAQTLFNREQES